jgi:hypothetical protein
MKKILAVILSAAFTCGAFAQSKDEVNVNAGNRETNTRFANKKKKGYYNITQVSMLMGNREVKERYPYPYYYPSLYSSYLPVDSRFLPNIYHNARTELQVLPSVTMTNGYMFNEHWAAGIGVGFEIFEHNHFPLFADIRYTLWDSKVSPYFAVKTGYAFGNFKSRHYDSDESLVLNYEPYYAHNADFRNYGGYLLHPEMGVKVPLSDNADLLFTVAYRYQKVKTKITQTYDGGITTNEWEHKESLNRLSFGVAIMFR